MDLGKLPDFKVVEREETRQNVCMDLLIKNGFTSNAKGDKWRGMWAKLVKNSGVQPFQLEKIINVGARLERLGKAQGRGFTRNRLQNKDWHKYEI